MRRSELGAHQDSPSTPADLLALQPTSELLVRLADASHGQIVTLISASTAASCQEDFQCAQLLLYDAHGMISG